MFPFVQPTCWCQSKQFLVKTSSSAKMIFVHCGWIICSFLFILFHYILIFIRSMMNESVLGLEGEANRAIYPSNNVDSYEPDRVSTGCQDKWPGCQGKCPKVFSASNTFCFSDSRTSAITRNPSLACLNCASLQIKQVSWRERKEEVSMNLLQG